MESNYYKETLPKLVETYKVAVEQCLEVIERVLPNDITEDKFLNVLKSKRMASEDAKFYAKEIDALENEINGVTIEESETTTTNTVKKYIPLVVSRVVVIVVNSFSNKESILKFLTIKNRPTLH